MDQNQRVVVLVEETEAARKALQWAARNFLRGADSITLLHVHPSTRSRSRQKKLRLKGFQLALSFKELCNGIAEAKVEITVMEGDQAASIVSLVNKIGAATLIVGLHDQSFVYQRATAIFGVRSLGCRILAIKQHSTVYDAELSQVEITPLRSEQRASFQVFPCPMWKKRSRRRR
ncbi:uncharacterized protein M6B38_237650 [Iris pallida]|uniref:UspA domain-containing protein n=1 Tax=Iris pallida TaxID=29817 RepID=A0AAX6DM55_IRIPA|nr:uncharacterized protein M6B38_237650 [Iris pallida]